MIPQDKQILLVDPDPAECRSLEELLSRAGYQVKATHAADEAIASATRHDIDLVLADGSVLAAGDGQVLGSLKEVCREAAVVALVERDQATGSGRLLSDGVEDTVARPVDPLELRRRVDRILEHRDLRTRVVHLQRELAPSAERSSLVRRSAAMETIHRQIVHVAPTRSTVLVLGESGVGKELVARALHSLSPRQARPFIPINCAAIPETLIESELFGHEKGAFTGAFSRAKGKFELAHSGSIFLDEIGEMNLSTQVKLLRVLEGQEFMRVGGNRSVRVDVRVIAATNTDLRKMIAAGRFRDDLYFRLKVVTIEVPPLRKRRDDIPQLVDEFLDLLSRQNNVERKTISAEALERLRGYDWPGNVRELKNLLESLIVSSPAANIGIEDLPAELSEATTPEQPVPTLKEMEKDLIVRALRQVGGNRNRAARALAIGIRTLQRKIQKYDIDPQVGR